METLRRWDEKWARGEAILAVAILLAMIVIAAAQAFLRNMTNFHFDWANAALAHIDWADQFLQKGTLWVAFLGASLATHDEKHIAIDILHRLSGPRLDLFLRGLVSLVAGVTCVFLCYVFSLSVANNAKDLPFEFSVLSGDGQIHICDAPAEALGDGASRPTIFCAVRSVFQSIGIPATTPGTLAQVIVPIVFAVMAVRFLARSLASFINLARHQYPAEQNKEA